MDSDEINSISDTTESQQVVKIIKTVYDDILSRGDLAVYKTPFNLNASIDILKPVVMTKPLIIDDIYWIKYNRVLLAGTTPVWVELKYMPIDDYLRMIQQLNVSELTVNSFTMTTSDGFNLVFNYRNNIGPTYYTSFDDQTLIFDGIDKAVDSTLQTSKTLGFGSRTTAFTETDAFVPALQPGQFALLLNEAKSLAWAELKQTPHAKAEQTARRNWRHLAKTRQHIPNIGRVDKGARLNPLDSFPNFSRR